MKIGTIVQVSPEDRGRLERLVADRNTPQKQARRAAIVRASADGAGTMEIMARTGPVRIPVDQVPPGVELAAGMTAAVAIGRAIASDAPESHRLS